MTETEFALSVHDLRKVFGATVALDGATFAVKSGSVHALLGENGAGKSTIVKTLSGMIPPDSGTIEIFGRPCEIASPRDAHALGIQTAFQEMILVRDLTVVQNMLLPYEPVGRLGGVQRREAHKLVVDHLVALGLQDIDPNREVRELELPLRQKIEIARSVLRKPKILLLDEPTSTLSGGDIDWLGERIARLTAQGTTVIFISHRMPEVRRFCEYLTVLRNGKDVGSGRVGEISDDEVIRMIVGRSIASTFPPRTATVPRGGVPALAAHDISTHGRLANASFALAEGEVLGVAGLQGMGQLDLFLGCFGVMPLRSGRLEVYGKEVRLISPQDAIRANIGISLVPEDRKTEALFLKLDGRRNVSLPVIDRFTRFGLIDGRAEIDAVGQVLDRVQVQPRALYTRVSAFSGGNQQKIAVAKWLLAESRILLMYDPTRGVDVGTKHDIYVLIRDFARAGGSVLLFSTEIPELVNLCDRVLVFYGGRITRELAGDAIAEETIIRAALGETQAADVHPAEVK
ncbi:MAG: sugar ABC transporter ATP-binding protein [Stellaceae bacterium]